MTNSQTKTYVHVEDHLLNSFCQGRISFFDSWQHNYRRNPILLLEIVEIPIPTLACLNQIYTNKIPLEIECNRPHWGDRPRVNQGFLDYILCELKLIFRVQLVEKQTENDLRDLLATRFVSHDCISHNRRRRVL